jgi:hypothetical protein
LALFLYTAKLLSIYLFIRVCIGALSKVAVAVAVAVAEILP